MIQLLSNVWVQVGIFAALFIVSGILAKRFKVAQYLFFILCAVMAAYILYGIAWAWIINPFFK